MIEHTNSLLFVWMAFHGVYQGGDPNLSPDVPVEQAIPLQSSAAVLFEDITCKELTCS